MGEGRSGSTVHVAVAELGRVYGGVPLGPGEQAARAQRWGWWYFAEHMVRQLRTYITSVLFYDLGQIFLYLIAMGLALGSLVDANTESVDGVSYLVFVAPALVVSSAVTTAAGEMTYPIMEGFKWRRTYYGPAAAPLTGGQIAFGHHLTAMVRYAAQSVFALGLLALFGALHSPHAWLLVPIATLTGIAFGAPLQAFAATLKDEGFAFSAIQRFVVMPMFLFAGTFFPLTNMPGYLQWIGWISPIWHGTELSRAATYGHVVEPWRMAVHLVVLTTLAVLGLVLARRIYVRRLSE
ncbi:MAG TPA: ABC transporter permease [Actinomycetales bacterium]|nr:ABC transporter permease [Actinomycetales bacterium]